MKALKSLLFVSIITFLSFQNAFALPWPSIPTRQFLIANYGASTTSLDNSAAINAAITAANSAGGGTVVISGGTFLSGPITMKSNVNLFIDANDTLRMMPYGNGNGSPAGSYPNDGNADEYAVFIWGQNLSNIEISGMGTIEGDGSAWWTAYKANKNISRPCMIRFKACNTVLIKDITLHNAPNVHITLGQSGSSYGSNGTIYNVKVNAPSTSPNTDAIDTWYWNGIDIEYCNLSEGDDNVAIDSYTRNVTIKHCTFGTGHGLSVGSYTTDVQNVFADSCTFNGTTNGIRLKSNNTRGGNDSTFVYSNMTMNNVTYPFYITSWYDNEPYPASSQAASSVTSTTPYFKNITFKNITVTNSAYAGIIYGRPESYIKNVTFDNVQIGASSGGMIANYVNGLNFINCSSISIPSSRGNALVTQKGSTAAPYQVTFSGINYLTGASTSCQSGINETTSQAKVLIYPNPVSGDLLNVSSDGLISEVKVFDLDGRQLSVFKQINEASCSLNLQSLKSGCYLLEVDNVNGKKADLKFIKE